MNEPKFQIVDSTSAETFEKSHVTEVEEMIDLVFPIDWIEFASETNGGVPVEKYFKLEENTKVLDFFLCLDPDYETSDTGDFDIGVVWSNIEDRLNDYLIPFAAVFAGDYLCFDYEGVEGDVPKIVLWNHDLSEEDEPATEDVASDFATFLTMLSEEGE